MPPEYRRQRLRRFVRLPASSNNRNITIQQIRTQTSMSPYPPTIQSQRRFLETKNPCHNPRKTDQILRLKMKGWNLQTLLRDVHLRPPSHPNFHQLSRSNQCHASKRFSLCSTPPRDINCRIPNLCNVEYILSIGTDHIEKNDAGPIC